MIMSSSLGDEVHLLSFDCSVTSVSTSKQVRYFVVCLSVWLILGGVTDARLLAVLWHPAVRDRDNVVDGVIRHGVAAEVLSARVVVTVCKSRGVVGLVAARAVIRVVETSGAWTTASSSGRTSCCISGDPSTSFLVAAAKEGPPLA